MRRDKFIVTGMSCSACSSSVEKTTNNLDGVSEASVNLLTNSMFVVYDESITNKEKIKDAVTNIGFGIEDFKKEENSNKDKNKKEDIIELEIKKSKKRLVISVIFLVPLMYLAMGHMIHQMISIPMPKIIHNIFYGNENAIILTFSQFLLTMPIVIANKKYFTGGFKSLLKRSPNMDSLIAIGAGASLLYGIIAIYRIGYGLGHGDLVVVESYAHDLYFETAGMILTLITMGKYLETRSKGKTKEAVQKLMKLAPQTITVERDGIIEEIDLIDAVKGDIIIVKPGEAIGADGIIIEGSTDVDQSAITGESIPVVKTVGEKVISGTINISGYLKFRAEHVGEDSTISKIINLVEEASSTKAPIAKLADKISSVFVPIVFLIAIVSGITWILLGESFEFALSMSIAVLVISCPCALGLATPVAIMVGTGKGAENGILIKSGEALEIAHNIDVVVLDKTGTITTGKPVVTDVKEMNVNKSRLLSIAAGLENLSEHPIAKAIVDYTKHFDIKPMKVEDFKAIFGKGVRGNIEGNTCFAGSIQLLEDNGIKTKAIESLMEELQKQGKTPVVFAIDTAIIGVIAVADVEKETSKKAIELFHKMKIDVVMLTGDNKNTAETIRKKLGINTVIAEVMPEDKEKHIASLQAQGKIVAMIGDGINDAPALAKADVGIAIGAGSDIAIESADAILIRNDLLDAVTAISLSKAVLKNIKQNLFWAFFYNVICIPIAAGAFYYAFDLKLSPMIGAAAMSVSSIFVVLNALRLKRFKMAKTLSSKNS